MALKIQADNLICHIVGINNHLKEELISSLADPSLVIKDLGQPLGQTQLYAHI